MVVVLVSSVGIVGTCFMYGAGVFEKGKKKKKERKKIHSFIGDRY